MNCVPPFVGFFFDPIVSNGVGGVGGAMQKHKNRHKREGLGVVVVVCFFVLLIVYLRFVMQHADEIRRRQDAAHPNGGNRIDGGGGNVGLIAEDEVEGGLGVEWDMLSGGGTRTNKQQRPTMAVTGDAQPRSSHAAGAPSMAPEGARDAEVVVHQPQLQPVADTEPPMPVNPKVHSRPMGPSDMHYALSLMAVDPNAPPRSNRLVDAYQDVAEYNGDAPFFHQNGHIFDHIPHMAVLLRKWQTLNLEMRQGKRPKRFVTVHPVGQLCNRLMAIASATVFALVTKRGLVVDDAGFYAQSSDLFEEPGFDWVHSSDSTVGGHYITNPESGVWPETEKLLCGDYSVAYPDRHVEFSINQYLVPYIINNPHYRQDMMALVRGEDVFYPISHFLFRPIASIRTLRDRFVADHFAGHFVVGLQVRSGSDFTDHFATQKDWELYRDCAEAVVPPAERRNVVFFLATDTEDGRTQGRRVLQTSSNNLSHPVLVSTPQFLLSNHPEGVQKALLDLLLLAASNDRVMTAWSSYGYFAAGYSGQHGNMVVDEVPESQRRAAPGSNMEQRFMGVPHKSDHRRQCVRLPTHQPCFHKFESWGASKASCFTSQFFEREMLNGRYC